MFLEVLNAVPEVLGAILMILGGLKLFARYTKTEADDKILAAVEKPLKLLKEALSKKK